MNYVRAKLRQPKCLVFEVIHNCKKEPQGSFEEVLVYNQLLGTYLGFTIYP